MTTQGRIDQSIIGSEVRTLDGDRLGTVEEIQGDAVKVNVAMRPDFWVRRDAIRSAGGGQVTLDVDKDHLDNAKVQAPSGPPPAMTGTARDGQTINTENGVYDAMRVTEMANDFPGTLQQDTIAPETNIPPPYSPAFLTVQGRPWAEASPTYREQWERRGGGSGGRWEDVEPAYRYGHERRQEPKFQGRRWEEAEPELKSDFVLWVREEGYTCDDSTWDRARDINREAWESQNAAGPSRS